MPVYTRRLPVHTPTSPHPRSHRAAARAAARARCARAAPRARRPLVPSSSSSGVGASSSLSSSSLSSATHLAREALCAASCAAARCISCLCRLLAACCPLRHVLRVAQQVRRRALVVARVVHLLDDAEELALVRLQGVHHAFCGRLQPLLGTRHGAGAGAEGVSHRSHACAHPCSTAGLAVLSDRDKVCNGRRATALPPPCTRHPRGPLGTSLAQDQAMSRPPHRAARWRASATAEHTNHVCTAWLGARCVHACASAR